MIHAEAGTVEILLFHGVSDFWISFLPCFRCSWRCSFHRQECRFFSDMGYYGDERERTANGYNMHLYDPSRSFGVFEIPIIRKTLFVPDKLIGFNYVNTAKGRDAGVHFFWMIINSRLIGQVMQDAGCVVVPTLQWSEPETYQFCFDGIEPGGCVAASTVGVMRDKYAQELWSLGMDEAIKKLNPSMVLCYGKKPEYDFGDTPVKYYSPRRF